VAKATGSTPDLSPAGYAGRLDRLLAHWDSLNVSQPSLRGRPDVTPARALTIWGLAAHAHAQARFVRQLGAAGVEVAPMVRTAYECALSAQWIITRGPRALPAFLNEGARQRLNLGKSMREAQWAGMTQEIVDQLEAERLPKGDLDDQAKQVHKIIDDFHIGPTLYAVYRFLSGFSHAGISVVDAYQTDDPSSPVGLALLRTGRLAGVGSWVWILVWTLVWAGRALDWITLGSPSRHFYKGIARESGMPGAVLVPTQAARAQAFADEHRASRRPPSA
jgi:hypothetical protein